MLQDLGCGGLARLAHLALMGLLLVDLEVLVRLPAPVALLRGPGAAAILALLLVAVLRHLATAVELVMGLELDGAVRFAAVAVVAADIAATALRGGGGVARLGWGRCLVLAQDVDLLLGELSLPGLEASLHVLEELLIGSAIQGPLEVMWSRLLLVLVRSSVHITMDIAPHVLIIRRPVESVVHWVVNELLKHLCLPVLLELLRGVLLSRGGLLRGLDLAILLWGVGLIGDGATTDPKLCMECLHHLSLLPRQVVIVGLDVVVVVGVEPPSVSHGPGHELDLVVLEEVEGPAGGVAHAVVEGVGGRQADVVGRVLNQGLLIEHVVQELEVRRIHGIALVGPLMPGWLAWLGLVRGRGDVLHDVGTGGVVLSRHVGNVAC